MTTFFEKHQAIKRIVSMVLAYLSVLSISKIFSLNSDISNYFTGLYWGYNVGAILVFLFGGFVLCRFLTNRDKRLKILSTLAGVLVALACVYGAYAHYVNDIFISLKDGILQLFLVAGISFLTVPLSAEIFLLTDKASHWLKEKQKIALEKETVKKPWLYFLCVWAIIFVCYIPIFLAYWPGNFVFDAKDQLKDVFLYTHSTHHPLIHTLLMGQAYELGINMGNVSAGFQFYTLIQMFVLSASFAYSLLYLYRKKVYRGIRVGTLLFFALFPMNALFAISSTKDVLCAAFFLISVIFYIRLLYDKEQFKWYSYFGLIVSNVLLALFRNNALYAVILFIVIGLFVVKGWKDKLKILILLMAIYVLTGLCNDALIRSVEAREPDTYRETLSVPLQCLARVAAYRGDELSEDLYNEICLYIRDIDIPNYNPYNSDAIKNYANESLLRENTVSFFKLWVKVGLQFPDEYFESLVTNTLGYWFPLNQGSYATMGISLYHTLIGVGPEITKENYFPLASKVYDPLFYEGNAQYTPVLGYLFRTVLYVWFYIYAFIWSICKKDKRGILLLCLPVVYLLTCMAGPMAALRYIYSIIVCIPIFVHLAIREKEESPKVEEK